MSVVRYSKTVPICYSSVSRNSNVVQHQRKARAYNEGKLTFNRILCDRTNKYFRELTPQSADYQVSPVEHAPPVKKHRSVRRVRRTGCKSNDQFCVTATL
jgi:hypothetical protein